MHIFLVYVRRLVEWLLLSAIGHGIMQFLATREIYPDKFVASMIMDVTEAPIWADWIIAGAFGLLIIPCSCHNPKILWVDDAEVVGD